MAELVEHLKLAIEPATRRLVTLAFERAAGPMAEAVYAGDGLAAAAVVLGADGQFCRAAELRLPRAEDLAIFEQLAGLSPDSTKPEFVLADKLLLSQARKVLDDLHAPAVENLAYLNRGSESWSLLEKAAGYHRHAGKVFWETFLRWVLARFGGAHFLALAAQKILPTANDDLASSDERVFFAPVATLARTEGAAVIPPGSGDEEAEELSAVTDSVAPYLRLFDESCLPIRTGGARAKDYTELAQLLAPPGGGGLVRRPRQEELIGDALIPAQAAARNDRQRTLALLYQAFLWLGTMPTKSRDSRACKNRDIARTGSEPGRTMDLGQGG